MRIVQIGIGRCGENHARILSQLGVLKAICDVDPQRGAECAERYCVNHYSSVEELLQMAEEFDGAFVVTPTSTHAEIVEELLCARKHVFVERPMTYQSGQGQRLVELAERNKMVLACGYVERFNPAVDAIKKIVAEEKFGSLVTLEFRREDKMPLRAKDARIIHDVSGQDIDIANWLFGDTPHVVFARAGKIKHTDEDLANIMLGYGDDRVAVISSNWIAPRKAIKLRATFAGGGAVTSDLISQKVTIEREESDGEETVEGGKDAEPQEALLLGIQSFLEAIEQKEQRRDHSMARPQEALNVTKIAEAALLSSQKGSPIYQSLK